MTANNKKLTRMDVWEGGEKTLNTHADVFHTNMNQFPTSAFSKLIFCRQSI